LGLALEICTNAGAPVEAATAFLLERAGDVQAALGLLLKVGGGVGKVQQ